jgi:hypothetical protein
MTKFREDVAEENESDEKRLFSFNKIIPMPSALEGTTKGSLSGIGYDAFYGDPQYVLNYPWVKSEGVTTVEELRDFLVKKDFRYKAEADRAKKAEKETGFRDWYDWSIENWGTKWNACSIDVNASEDCLFDIRFDSAWSLPEPVLFALAKKYPNLEFSGSFIEEDQSFEGDFDSDFDSEEMEINVSEVARDDDDDEGPEVNLGEIQQNNWF